jgi:hypothetical protein
VIKKLIIQERWFWFENHIFEIRMKNSDELIGYTLLRQIGDSLEPNSNSAIVIVGTIVNHVSE